MIILSNFERRSLLVLLVKVKTKNLGIFSDCNNKAWDILVIVVDFPVPGAAKTIKTGGGFPVVYKLMISSWDSSAKYWRDYIIIIMIDYTLVDFIYNKIYERVNNITNKYIINNNNK